MSSAPGPAESGLSSGFSSGFSSSRPSAFAPSQPPGPGGRTPVRGGGVRYRHRAHALAREREYRVGTHTLRWHDAAHPERGTGQMAYTQIAAMRLEALGGQGAAKRCRLTLRPRVGPPVVIDSDSAEGWFGRRAQAEAYRRFVRTLHAAALQVQPQLRLEAPPAPRLAGLGPALLALGTAATLGVVQGPLPALAGLALVWPLAQWAGRWQQGRRAAALPRGTLPRHLLP
jgi:hypothetical protein